MHPRSPSACAASTSTAMPELSMNVTPERSTTTGPPASTYGLSSRATSMAEAMSISANNLTTGLVGIACTVCMPRPPACVSLVPTPGLYTSRGSRSVRSMT
jgi:hypothetical protein